MFVETLGLETSDVLHVAVAVWDKVLPTHDTQ